MFGFTLVAIAIFIAGLAAARFAFLKLDADGLDDTGPIELATAGAVVGTALWLTGNWLLALTKTFTRMSVFVLAALFVLRAAILCVRAARGLRSKRFSPATTTIAVLLPVLAWSIFALWRGAVIPPLAHDALAYHLPKSVLLIKDHGYRPSYAPDPRITSLPTNYEILVADVLLLDGSDDITEWIATAMFLLFLLGSAALAERWWGRGRHIPAAILTTAVTPILLLQSSTQKNDIMMGLFGATAILWGARWVARGGRTAMALLMISLVLGVGTKPNVAAVGFGLAPFLLFAAVRRIRARTLALRDVAVTALFGLILFAVAGGASYLYSFITTGAPVSASTGAGNVSAVQYGDWQNLWQVPYLILTVPFSPNPMGVWLPWRGEYWFWPRYEMFFSHLGPLFSILVIALPFCVWRYRREEPIARRAERIAGGLAALLTFIIMLPAEVRPVGFFAAFPRYCLFLVPIVICWTIVPFTRSLEQRGDRAVVIVLAVLAVFFCAQAIEYAVRDRFTPLEYVRWAARHPGNRAIWFMPNRAASVVDRKAGPNDTIAIEGSFDTWTYPAYGRALTRDVVFLPPNATARDIPPEADWVIVDRSWNAIWGHPKLTDMGQFWTYFNKGQPTAEDVRLIELLVRDPRFKLEYRAPRTNQAVFRRIRSMAQ